MQQYSSHPSCGSISDLPPYLDSKKLLILEQTTNCTFVLALENSSHRFAVR